jgi:sporulation protein YlmC with PRC-barrel domain
MAAVLSASTLVGNKVKNLDGEDLGKIEDIVIDLASGRVAYAVVSFGGGFMHSGKFLAIPWPSLAVDQGDKKVILNVPKDTLESAEGFDKDNWPDLADDAFRRRTYGHYGVTAW